jgi:hypothetical protein
MSPTSSLFAFGRGADDHQQALRGFLEPGLQMDAVNDAPQHPAAGPSGNSPPATSCSAPSASPPPGRCRSISLIPKGSTVRQRAAAPLKALDALSKVLDNR